MYATRDGPVDQVADLGPLLGEPGEAMVEKAEHLLRRQGGDQGERGDELGVFVVRLPDQVAHPVVQLLPPRVGERVDRPLRPPALAAGLVLHDEPCPGELPDHHVERGVGEPDAAVVAVVAQGPAQLVRMHRSLREVGQHRQRQQVVDLAFLHLVRIDYPSGCSQP